MSKEGQWIEQGTDPKTCGMGSGAYTDGHYTGTVDCIVVPVGSS